MRYGYTNGLISGHTWFTNRKTRTNRCCSTANLNRSSRCCRCSNCSSRACDFSTSSFCPSCCCRTIDWRRCRACQSAARRRPASVRRSSNSVLQIPHKDSERGIEPLRVCAIESTMEQRSYLALSARCCWPTVPSTTGIPASCAPPRALV